MLTYFILATLVAAGVMLMAFVLALSLNFFSLVDVAWSYGFALVAGACAIYAGIVDLRLVFLCMIAIWSVRLGTHLLKRLAAHFPNEDTRYVTLRTKWAGALKTRFAIFFFMQGVSLVALSVPIVLVFATPTYSLSLVSIIAGIVWLIAIAGEASADAQLRAFKTDPANKGRVCDVGLWRYSRHPNYFFEWLVWCAYALFALQATFGIFALVAPALIFVLVYFVSGVPLNEAQSLKSKGTLYIDYQRRTSKFIPWFPKAK